MTRVEHRVTSEGGGRAFAVAAVLMATGQIAFLVLARFSRATTADSILGGSVFLSPDSYGYLENAATWAGIGRETWNRWGFLAVIRLGEYLGSGAAFLVVVQVLLLTAAGAAVFDLGRRLSGMAAGVVAASAVLLNPMVFQWVRFVQTEIMFYSLVLLAAWCAERVLAGRGGGTALVLVAVAVSVTRPNGVLVGAACATVLVLRHVRRPRRGIAILLVWIAAASALVLGLEDATPRYGWDTAAYTVGGVVIEGSEHARTSIAMPTPDAAVTSNSELLRYVAEHPIAVARLAIQRIWTETIQIRRHYPAVVNLGVGIFMIGYAGATVVGLIVLRRSDLTKVVLLIAAPLALLVGGTFAVPEGRFGWAYLVAFAAHVGVGTSRILRTGRAITVRSAHSPPG